MKRTYLSLFFVVWGAALLQAQSVDSLWAKANEAYAQARYQEAFDHYKSIYDRGVGSAALYYNMGNSAFKTAHYAHAILWFERAKRLDPQNADIMYNLDLANRFCLDKITPLPEFFLHTWLRTVRDSLSANSWAWTTLLFLILAGLLLLTFFFGRSRIGRRWAFYGSICVLLLAMSAFSFGWSQREQLLRRDYAVVFAPVVAVKSAPDKQGKDLFIIHEGTKIRFLDQVGVWGRIELADGRQGWIEAEQAERI